jgi:hypothetical protein
VSEHLRAILNSSEFQEPLSSRAMHQLMHFLLAWFSWIGSLSTPALALIVAVCLAVLAAIAAQIWFAFRKNPSRPRKGGGIENLATVDPDLSPEAIAQRARALAGQGRLRDAARALQQSLLISLCLRRGLAWQPTLADWEWMDLLRASPGLVDFTRRTQLLAFGTKPEPAAFDECVLLYERLVSETA